MARIDHLLNHGGPRERISPESLLVDRVLMMKATYDAAKHITDPRWLCLHRNENLFAETVWSADERARLLARVSLSLYPDPECRELRTALAELYGVEPANVFVGNGSDEVLSILLAQLRSRYSMLRADPVGYRMYPVLAARHAYDVGAITESACAAGPAVLAIDSPNAITGAHWTPASIARFMLANDSFVVWDNCYGEFACDAVTRPIDGLAVVRTFSKYYGLAALRVGYCIADATLIRALYERKDIFNVNAMAQAAALEALRRRHVFERVASQLHHARGELILQLTALGFRVLPSFANFVLASHPAMPAQQIHDHLRQRLIAVRRFVGIGIDEYIRITVPPPAGVARLAAAMKAIVQVVPS